MKKYSHFLLEDFVLDNYFQQWVLFPDAESDNFWNEFQLLHASQKQVLAEARLVVAALRVKELTISEKQLQDSFVQVWEKMNEPDQRTESQQEPFVKWGNWKRYAVAASVSLLLALTGVWFFSQRLNTAEYKTAYGEISTITLPDESVVTLNANSRLSFSADWKGEGPREVWLEGEAFFKVQKKVIQTADGNAHSKKAFQRFIVHAGDLSVEVLGTSFNVKERGNQTKVVLKTGKVKLNLDHGDQASMYMKPGDLVMFEKQKRTMTKQVVNPEQYSSWQHKKLILNNTPVSEVAQIMEETYGLTVVFEDPAIAQTVLNGTSLPTNNQQALIEAMAIALDVEIERQDNRLVFKK